MAKGTQSKRIRQIFGDGRETILTMKNGIIVGKKNVRRKKVNKMVNIFDPMTKVKMDFG